MRVSATVPLLEVARLRPGLSPRRAAAVLSNPELSAWLAGTVTSHLTLTDAAAGCAPAAGPTLRAASPRRLRLDWTLACSRTPRPAVRSDLFLDAAPTHLHFVRLDGGGRRHEAVLGSARRQVDFSPPPPGQEAPPPAAGFLATVRTGLEHVAGGWDHVAFVVGLMLLGGGLLRVLAIATGFTLGHSLTLAVAALGLVRPDEPAVEVLVGLSIAYVALECFHARLEAVGRHLCLAANLLLHGALALLAARAGSPVTLPLVLGSALFTSCHLALHRDASDTAGLRWALAFAFGLVHGFAFAGAFSELLAGGDLVTTLLGFNVGVELGQAAVIVGVAGGLAALARVRSRQAAVLAGDVAAAAVLALGVSWTLTRAL